MLRRRTLQTYPLCLGEPLFRMFREHPPVLVQVDEDLVDIPRPGRQIRPRDAAAPPSVGGGFFELLGRAGGAGQGCWVGWGGWAGLGWDGVVLSCLFGLQRKTWVRPALAGRCGPKFVGRNLWACRVLLEGSLLEEGFEVGKPKESQPFLGAWARA